VQNLDFKIVGVGAVGATVGKTIFEYVFKGKIIK
jgi:hypothetical protein